mmetsp:Transcript_12965/g.55332  ORF Transcript_12965/g.55332 Transcript_12965/m.55332 type:complete len:218 (+) Transcript_12965:1950-2603(+)
MFRVSRFVRTSQTSRGFFSSERDSAGFALRSLAAAPLLSSEDLPVPRAILVTPERSLGVAPRVVLPVFRGVPLLRVRRLLALGLAILVQVHLERLDVLLESERAHGPQQVVAVDGLALFALALIARLAGDEADELRDALLDRLLGVLGDLRVRGQRLLHDATDVGNWQEAVLFSNVTALLVVVVVDVGRSLFGRVVVVSGHRAIRATGFARSVSRAR